MDDLWGLGDYDRVARRMRPAADALVEAAGMWPGRRVLDLAAGTGNVAIAAARRGGAVTALDASPALVAQGRAATDRLGLDVHWVLGDFTGVDAPDASFDAVLSAFGLIYAADIDVALGEAFRLVAPDGVVAVATWAERGFQVEAHRALAAALDTPSAPSPWDSVDGLRSLFAPRASTMRIHDVHFDWCFDSPEHWLEQAMRVAPPLVALAQSADEARLAAARVALLETAQRFWSTGGIAQHAYVVVAAPRYS